MAPQRKNINICIGDTIKSIIIEDVTEPETIETEATICCGILC